jgi:beta-glucosidase
MVRISVDVSNAGDRDGHETVQIYAGCAALPFPALELKDFKKVWVPAGRSTTVDFALPVELLAHIEPDTGNWRIFPGTYTVLAGPNCREGLQSSLDIPDGVTIRAEFLLEADVVPTDQP